ncbi:MAG: hypothetical protein AAF485_30155, partial [Chloroflexota bacterium]
MGLLFTAIKPCFGIDLRSILFGLDVSACSRELIENRFVELRDFRVNLLPWLRDCGSVVAIC